MHEQLAEKLLGELEDRLRSADSRAVQTALNIILDRLDCATGTMHQLDSTTGQLQLLAQRGVPEHLLARIQCIPIGKGMAGLAAQRREPVQVCNLQTDGSGAAQPAARDTGMKGSIAVPILCGTQLVGVLGVARREAHEFDTAEIAVLSRIAGKIGEVLGQAADSR